MNDRSCLRYMPLPYQRAVKRCHLMLACVAAAFSWGFAAPSIAEEVPTYTKEQTVQPDCENDRPADRAIHGCPDMIEAPDGDPYERIRVYTMRGFAWLKDEEPIAAVSDFDRALQLDPENRSAIRGRAWAYERMEKYDGAIRDWTLLIKLNPREYEYFRERGYTYHLDSKYELAVADFSSALELDKNGIDSLIGRALAYGAMDKVPEALSDFEAAHTLNPKYSAVYIARAEMWERHGNIDNAIADYRSALELNTTNQKAAHALKRLGAANVPRRRLGE